MDPNLSKLDPKLREAYERVMNGANAPAPAGGPPPPPPVQGPPPLHTTPPIGSPMPQPMANPTPPPPPPPVNANPPIGGPQLNPAPAINSTMAFNAHNSSVNKGTSDVKKSGGMVKVLMLAVVVVAFLLIYTVVWVYLFHLKLPFIG